MEKKSNAHNWIIVCVSILMFMIHVTLQPQNGFYAWIWIMVGYYGYKSKYLTLKSLLNFLIILNISLVGFIVIFYQDSLDLHFGILNRILISLLISLIAIVSLFFYSKKKLGEADFDKTKEIVIQEEEIRKTEEEVIPQTYKNKGDVQQIVELKKYSKQAEVKEEDPIVNSEPKEKVKTGQEDKFTKENLNFYKIAFEEVNSDKKDIGIWAMCFTDSNGDEAIAKANYIKQRVKELTLAELITLEEKKSEENPNQPAWPFPFGPLSETKEVNIENELPPLTIEYLKKINTTLKLLDSSTLNKIKENAHRVIFSRRDISIIIFFLSSLGIMTREIAPNKFQIESNENTLHEEELHSFSMKLALIPIGMISN